MSRWDESTAILSPSEGKYRKLVSISRNQAQRNATRNCGHVLYVSRRVFVRFHGTREEAQNFLESDISAAKVASNEDFSL